jgi:hypothetical protein
MNLPFATVGGTLRVTMPTKAKKATKQKTATKAKKKVVAKKATKKAPAKKKTAPKAAMRSMRGGCGCGCR